MIKKIHIENYKIFEKFDLDFNDTMNLLVGDNEAGKSTILEAINLALTKRLDGKPLEYVLTPHLFNTATVEAYSAKLKEGIVSPPAIIIELYFDEIDDLQPLRGSTNSKKEDCPGICLEVAFDEDCWEEYKALVEEADNEITLVPTEYYSVKWRSFDDNAINPRTLPIAPSYIDATTIRLQSGTDYYLQDILRNDLDAKERANLSIAYRNLKQTFSEEKSIQEINEKLTTKKGTITEKDLSIAMDISQKSNWEANLMPHLDSLPFHLSGKGEQSALKIMIALERSGEKSNLILIEEPENHLSFASMSRLVSRIQEKCGGKQLFITTHSAYVLNKLGLDHLILLNGNTATSLKALPADTLSYFKKLPGYDTLRLVLSQRAILVEGPSDELIVQKAFKAQHGTLPIEQGVDVISVRGLSFARFLDIAQLLEKDVSVVTDNDGDHANKVAAKYAPYNASECISIYSSDDDTLPSLEQQMLAANDRATFNAILDKNYDNDADLVKHMVGNKTEVALKIFETDRDITFPDYIHDATS